MAVHHVLLAGGRGTRFWPMSRRRRPKQFLPLLSDESMLRQTWRRVLPVSRGARTWVLTNADLRKACLRELPELDAHRIIGEAQGRNTAAAIALAGVLAAAEDPRAILAVFPSDHFVADEKAFRRIVKRALRCAREDDALVTLGVTPTGPETAYGYIEAAGAFSSKSAEPLPVARFIEKPKPARAKAFFNGGKHLWNSGMFFFSAKALREAFSRCAPEIWDALAPLAASIGKPRFKRELAAIYAELPAMPFDTAVMEKADNVRVLPADMGWSDIGHWVSLAALAEELGDIGKSGDVFSMEAKRNTVIAPDGLTALLGVEDLLIVRAGDALLVCHRERAQKLRELVARMADAGLTRYL